MRPILALFIALLFIFSSCMTATNISIVTDDSFEKLDAKDYEAYPRITPIPNELISKSNLVNSTIILLNNWDVDGAKKLLRNHTNENDEYHLSKALIEYTISSYNLAKRFIDKIESKDYEIISKVMLADIYLFENNLKQNKADIIGKYKQLMNEYPEHTYLKKFCDMRLKSIEEFLSKNIQQTPILSPWNL